MRCLFNFPCCIKYFHWEVIGLSIKSADWSHENHFLFGNREVGFKYITLGQLYWKRSVYELLTVNYYQWEENWVFLSICWETHVLRRKKGRCCKCVDMQRVENRKYRLNADEKKDKCFRGVRGEKRRIASVWSWNHSRMFRILVYSHCLFACKHRNNRRLIKSPFFTLHSFEFLHFSQILLISYFSICHCINLFRRHLYTLICIENKTCCPY